MSGRTHRRAGTVRRPPGPVPDRSPTAGRRLPRGWPLPGEGARPHDEGSLSVEFVMVAPALLMVLALVFAYGRVAQVNSILDAGVRDAARSVTQARSDVEAQEVAREVVAEAFTEPSGRRAETCLNTLRVELLPTDTFERGGAVTVRASCRYSMRDLWIPGLRGELTSSSAFTSQLDPNRGVRDG